MTRRQLLRGAGAMAGLAAGGGGLIGLLDLSGKPRRIASYAVKPAGEKRAFHSRPDLEPPTVKTTVAATVPITGRTDPDDPPGFVFLGPGPVSLQASQQYGPMIVDRAGEPVWFRPLADGREATNFTTATYRGEPVLLWWEGTIEWTGYGQGEAVIVDRTYREVARVRAANGRTMDLHALWLTPQGTAFFTCYPETVEADLRPVGGPRRGQALQSIIQEVDVATGRLLFEWKSLSHIGIDESYMAPGLLPPKEPFDYLHVNAVSATPDGNLLVSGRLAWTLYKLERHTGRVMWRLGGKRSDFRLGAGAQFYWQHDGRQVSDGLITVFDNGSDGYTNTEKESRGLVLSVDERRRTVALKQAFTSPSRLATSMGSVQVLESGRVVVGWGTASGTSEFQPDGSLMFDAQLPAGLYSYRGLWLDWESSPRHRPALASAPSDDASARLLFASWNGATELAGWRVDAGPARDALKTVGIAERHGFETVIPIHPSARFAAVTALDRYGAELRTSDTIAV